MSRIDELIAEFCPSGVEYVRLADIFTVLRGKRLTKSKLDENAEHFVYHGGLKPLGKFYEYNREAETVMVINVGASAGSVGYSRDKFWSSDGCYCLSHSEKMESRFAYYLLLTFQKFFVSQVRRAGIPTLDSDVIASIRIPLPPLEVQKEIVRILDKFTNLESELSAELDARRKQYDYYRNQLLTFDETSKGVRWLSLLDVCKAISAGGDLPKNFKKGQSEPSEEFPYPIYSNGSDEKALYGYTNGYKVENEAVTVSARGTIGFHAIRQPKFTPIVRLITLIPNHSILTTKFLNYALDITEIGHSGGSIPQLTVPNIKKIIIPVPIIAEQNRITDLLDKFDTLSNSFSDGLPAEIKARRKQYEYYRNKLLTFQELPA